jgi:hypothetical protein
MKSERLKRILKKGPGLMLFLVLCPLIVMGLNSLLKRNTDVTKSQANGSREKAAITLAKVTLPFVPNQGQWDSRIKFRADLFSGSFFVTDSELVYALLKSEEAETADKDEILSNGIASNLNNSAHRFRQVAFKETFLNPHGQRLYFSSLGEEIARTKVSYFSGNDSQGWRENLSSYETVSLNEVYPGIEVKLKASASNVEKMFYLRPGTAVDEIKVGVDGLRSLELNQAGELVLETAAGKLVMMKPAAYQEVDGRREYINVAYELKGEKEYGFKILDSYDPGLPLVIDPALSTLSASTLIGGAGNDRGFCIAVDNPGNVYVAGYTLSSSSDFPTTDGAFDTTYNGNYDVVVSKLSSSLDSLLASTYVGGKGADYVYSTVLDSSANVYVAGITNSSDFPTTAGAYYQSYQGGEYDAFIIKLSTDLNTLLCSTYFGGSGIDYGASIVLDTSWNVYLTGMTDSEDLPTTSGAYDTSYNGGYDAFISKLSNSLDTLLASTYIGGNNYEIASSIALDNSGNVVIGGRTKSPDYPTTAGAYDASYNGGYDIFVSKLSSSLDNLLSSTFLGGSGNDYGYALALDNTDNIFVAGYTLSADFPVTEGAYDTAHNGSYDVFVSKFSGSLGTLLASSYVGGSGDDRCRAITLDAYGKVYITGWTKSSDFPNTSGAYDRVHNGNWDVFVSKLSARLSAVFSSTFVGGTGDDLSYHLALDSPGNVYVTGYTLSSGFPTTKGAYDTAISGTDLFVLKFDAADQYLLTVNRSGDGSGTATSADGGINCATDCSELYDSGTKVTLTATPEAGSVFAGWTGDAVSNDSTFTVTMDSDKTLTVRFLPETSTYTLTVIKSGPGNGTVTSEDGGINCGSDCSETYSAGTVVKLTATPDGNSGFDSWSGDVSGSEATIKVMVDSDKTVVANFGPTPLPDLTGEWSNLKMTTFLGRATILSAFLRLKNIGEATASSGYKISYYLSADGTSLDTLLSTRHILFSLAANASRNILFSKYVRGSIAVSGKYLVAVIDSDETLEEKDETNNRIIFGPLQ